MFITGNTNVTLFKKCPITPTNQIDFANLQKQCEYFETLEKKVFSTKFKYIDRKSFKVKEPVDNINMYNYGYYENLYNSSAKRFYFFVNSFRMINSDVTEISISIDSFQTYMFNYEFNECFIEREHVSNDEIGKNVISENLETGEYINLGKTYIKGNSNGLAIVCGVADADNGVLGGVYNGFYQGLKYWSCGVENWEKMNEFIQGLCNEGHADTIVNIFVCPIAIVSDLSFSSEGGYLSNVHVTSPKSITYDVSSPTTINGYTPYNKKCFTYPYTVLSVRNWDGCTHALKPQYFKDFKHIQFNFETAFSSGAKAVIYPLNYSNMEDSNILDCTMAVTTSWASDVYSNWYAQNKPLLNATSANAGNSYATGIQNSNISYNTAKKQNDVQFTRNENSMLQNAVNGALSSVGSLLSLDVGGLVGGVAQTANNMYWQSQDSTLAYDQSKIGYTSARTIAKNSLGTTYENEIRSLMATNESHSIAPCQAKGDTSSCGLDLISGRYGFVVEWLGMQYDCARAVDTFFQMYGYKVNRIGIPYTKNRKYWNYVKTENCQLYGDVPREDLEKISAMYDNGITIWHWNGGSLKMFNYNRENTIIGTVISGKLS